MGKWALLVEGEGQVLRAKLLTGLGPSQMSAVTILITEIAIIEAPAPVDDIDDAQ